MAKELTSGFDVAAHISEDTIERIFQSYYWLGNFPNYVSKTFSQGGKDFIVEVFFKEPELELAAPTPTQNPVRLTFGFTVRLSNYDWEDSGSASVQLSAIPLTFPEGDSNVTALGVDFGSLGNGDFTFTSAAYPEFASVVKPLILSSLLQTQSVILSPPSSISAELLTWKTYTDDDGKRFLGVFINTSPGNPTIPQSTTSFLSASSDARIAIPIENIKKVIASGLESMGLDDLPATLQVDGDEYTVNALSIKLKNHYLEVTGDVDDVEFVAKGDLYATDTGLELNVTWLDIDMPWYMDIANALSGGVIQRALEAALPSALGDVGVGAFVGVGVFSKSVPGVDLLLEVHNHGFVTTGTNGIVLSASIDPVFDAIPIKEPTYLKGNKETKEFHRPGCPFGSKLKWQKTVTFIREDAAIHAGYNGCFTCANEYSHPAGRVIFGYQAGGNPPNQPVDMQVTVEAKLMAPIVVDGVTVIDPPFSSVLHSTAKANAAGVWQAMDYSSSNLLIPGLWRFRAHSGNWTGECTMQIKPTAAKFGATNQVAFTVGKPKGNFGYGKMPLFP